MEPQQELTADSWPPNERVVSIDVVRMFGILCVVGGHVWVESPLGGYVAIFFVIAGYLWSNKRSLRSEAAHRAKKLLLPYLGWMVFVSILVSYDYFQSGASTSGYLRHFAAILAGGRYLTSPYTAYWFMTAIFVACVVYRFASSLDRRLYRAMIALSALSTIVGPQLSKLPLAIGVGFSCVTFIAAGEFFRKIERCITHPRMFAVSAGFLSIFLICNGCAHKMFLKQGHFGTPILSMAVVILISYSALVISKSVAVVIPRPIAYMVTAFVQMATPIILLHAVPIWLFGNTEMHRLLLFVICLAFSMGIGLLLHNLPKNGLARKILMPAK
ncbi:MAG: acyltransferase family protein [Bacteroidales bacterium]|nr:acyltransferase family protein [Bacteroidales bacterium]